MPLSIPDANDGKIVDLQAIQMTSSNLESRDPGLNQNNFYKLQCNRGLETGQKENENLSPSFTLTNSPVGWKMKEKNVVWKEVNVKNISQKEGKRKRKLEAENDDEGRILKEGKKQRYQKDGKCQQDGQDERNNVWKNSTTERKPVDTFALTLTRRKPNPTSFKTSSNPINITKGKKILNIVEFFENFENFENGKSKVSKIENLKFENVKSVANDDMPSQHNDCYSLIRKSTPSNDTTTVIGEGQVKILMSAPMGKVGPSTQVAWYGSGTANSRGGMGQVTGRDRSGWEGAPMGGQIRGQVTGSYRGQDSQVECSQSVKNLEKAM